MAGEALRTCTLVSTPYHWTFQMLWVMYWLTICLLVTFTTWLLVVQPVRSAKRAAKVRCMKQILCCACCPDWKCVWLLVVQPAKASMQPR